MAQSKKIENVLGALQAMIDKRSVSFQNYSNDDDDIFELTLEEHGLNAYDSFKQKDDTNFIDNAENESAFVVKPKNQELLKPYNSDKKKLYVSNNIDNHIKNLEFQQDQNNVYDYLNEQSKYSQEQHHLKYFTTTTNHQNSLTTKTTATNRCDDNTHDFVTANKNNQLVTKTSFTIKSDKLDRHKFIERDFASTDKIDNYQDIVDTNVKDKVKLNSNVKITIRSSGTPSEFKINSSEPISIYHDHHYYITNNETHNLISLTQQYVNRWLETHMPSIVNNLLAQETKKSIATNSKSIEVEDSSHTSTDNLSNESIKESNASVRGLDIKSNRLRHFNINKRYSNTFEYIEQLINEVGPKTTLDDLLSGRKTSITSHDDYTVNNNTFANGENKKQQQECNVNTKKAG